MAKTINNKPVIETLVNTSALALTSFGIVQITTNGGFYGFLPIAVGMALEFFKYWGRNKKLW